MFTSDYSTSIGIRPPSADRYPSKWKYTAAAAEFAPNCPRCASSNTKFCYYNNYSLSQPRYFCKACRRYWTKGGSLRNVPVGGGCRKSRRARAARQGTAPSCAGPAHAGPAQDANSGGAYIDMAAVFANYVSQKEENGESFSPSSGSSENVPASSNDSSQFDDISMFEYQEPLDLIGGGDDRMQQGVPQLSMCQDVSGQDFLYHGDFDELDGGVLGDGLLWSEGTTLQPNFGLEQEMVQGQDFGLVSPDDQLRICSNLVADNWGSFDLSTYEFYSTP